VTHFVSYPSISWTKPYHRTKLFPPTQWVLSNYFLASFSTALAQREQCSWVDGLERNDDRYRCLLCWHSRHSVWLVSLVQDSRVVKLRIRLIWLCRVFPRWGRMDVSNLLEVRFRVWYRFWFRFCSRFGYEVGVKLEVVL
jgi:hypothetical protein